MNDLLQRLAVYAAFGLVLDAAGATFDTPWFWCSLGLMWAGNHLDRRSGYELGVAQGIEMIADMTEEQRADIIAVVKQAQKEDNE